MGDMPQKNIDITGNKYSALTALRRLRYDGSSIGTVWEFRCDCGNVRELPLKTVTSGRTRTCGKCELKHQLDTLPVYVEDARKKALDAKKTQAIRMANSRGRKWALSDRDFYEISQKDCMLCGYHSETVHRNLLLVNPAQPYLADNVIPVCDKCLKYCGKHNIQQLLDHIGRIAKYLNLT